MIETRAGFLKLHSPRKDGEFTGEYSRIWMNRSAIHGLAASNGLMGSNTLVYAPAIPAYGHGAFAWECVEFIDEILDAIERIDKESSATQIVNVHNNKEG